MKPRKRPPADPIAFERFKLPSGDTLHLNSSPKLKTVLIQAEFTSDLDATVTRKALLPMVLRRGTRRLADMKSIHRFLEGLYGAGQGSDVGKIGEWHSLKFSLEVVNDRFIPRAAGPAGGRPAAARRRRPAKRPAPGVLREALGFLREIMFDPRLPGGSFDPHYVDQEKENLRRTIEGLVDDKSHYAFERCVREMCAGEEFRRYELGEVGDLAEIDAPRLTAAYREWAARCPMDLYISGDIDVRSVRGLCAEVFDDRRPGDLPLRGPPAPVAVGAPRTVEEKMDVNQGRLVLGFRHGIGYGGGDLEALVMMNGILGAFPHSKLFQNVREKASLAYDAHSQVERTKGLLFILCGIAVENYQRALQIILQQVEAVKAGQVSDEELVATRESLLNHLTLLEDDPGALMEIDRVWRLHGREFDLPAYRRRLAKVDRDRVAAAAGRLQLDTVYFLRN
jgi:predicted Zn-dependent peptidase